MHMAKTPQAHGILNVMRSDDKVLVNKHCVTEGHGVRDEGVGWAVTVKGVRVAMLRLNTIIPQT